MDKYEIEGKLVYVVESHRFALEAWAKIKRSHEEELNLITLDRHTDTHYAFDSSMKFNPKFEQVLPLISKRISEIDYRNDHDIERAVADLRNDEQIDAAIRLGLFRCAICINDHTDSSHWERERTKNPPRPIFEVHQWCLNENDDGHNKDECGFHQADQVIESEALRKLITKANNMASAIGFASVLDVPYVLDVDLDYFRSMKALSPDNTDVFYEIIRDALAITIATEPQYVMSGGIDKALTSDIALQAVLDHIQKAVSGQN